MSQALYEQVLQAAIDIVNASAREDVGGERNAKRRLRRQCLGPYPSLAVAAFFFETLADFTPSARLAIERYRVALEAARRSGSARFSILLALGGTYQRVGKRAAAARCYHAALRDAQHWRDREAIKEARARVGALAGAA
jgi:hypothetical protein